MTTQDQPAGTAPAKPQTARQRAREQTERELLDIARRHLGEVGAAGLSLRAIARERGMVSSAVYRYFDSRDALLTTLILEAYNALGAFVEHAEQTIPRADHQQRFAAAARAMRAWAVAHPHQYSLIYGSPVPGYAAPQDTIMAAARVGLVLFDIMRDAKNAGLHPRRTAALDHTVPAVKQLTSDFAPDLSPQLVALGVESWTRLYGAISFEVFGQFNQMVRDPAALYEFIIDEELARFGFAR
ncbi:TetR/AcrR family transcriptional regulator [Lysinibacter cavernae]|uniref:AcrR family transcriptional regulator n=1 Tax=Lysinibacter cavernae TaxID=1640652 RepID=A0A7X5TTC3_9MICO|nr:TetR/AcrR family transcriptional regulator [Lysinibacter cavernae]NIH54486.1 AcrR family transcriptional regulator [Lysinibacter cavernae]